MAVLEKSGSGGFTYTGPAVKNGIYDAEYIGEPEQFTSPFPVEDDQGNKTYPEKLRHNWLVELPDGETAELSSFTSLKVGHENATMTKYFVAARGQDFVDAINDDPEAQFDTDDLKGHKVSVTVKNKVSAQGVKTPRVVEVDAAE